MRRLIDADKAINMEFEEMMQHLEYGRDYNVDKVVEQINDLDTYFDNGDFATCHDRLVVLKDVNRIVKAGGVNG